MLKGIDPLLSPELLKLLAEMGHDDAVVLADANFTAMSLGAGKPVLRLPGVGMARTVDAVASVLPLAEPHERGGLLSTIYVLSYLAFSLPAIAAGLLTQSLGLVPTTYGYGVMLIVLGLLALAATRPQAVAGHGA